MNGIGFVAQNRGLDVRREVSEQMCSRHERGMIERRLMLDRDRVANLAASALGDTVSDTAIGAELINSWLTRYLNAQPVSGG